MWKPADKERILKDIEYCNAALFFKPDCLRFWEFIKIEPEKWTEQTMGEEGGGFWVVGILGKSVIYYNDIEEGYNLSPFRSYGEIDDYRPSQMELFEMIEGLYEEILRLKK